MEIAKLILAYITGLIYPLVIIGVIFYFRKELKLLFSGELSLKYRTCSKQLKF